MTLAIGQMSGQEQSKGEDQDIDILEFLTQCQVLWGNVIKILCSRLPWLEMVLPDPHFWVPWAGMAVLEIALFLLYSGRSSSNYLQTIRRVSAGWDSVYSLILSGVIALLKLFEQNIFHPFF